MPRPKSAYRWWLLALLIGRMAWAEASKPFRVLSAQPVPELAAPFARTDGWAGADGDYSIPLTPERVLWFFSDSWIGSITNGTRTNVVLVNNSVGVQTGYGANASVAFHWGRDAAGHPAAFLRPEDGRGWFWPCGGTMVGPRLHFLLWQMERAEGPAAFGFRNVAVWRAEVMNPLDPPPQWQVTQAKLPFTELGERRRLIFGSAVLRHDGFVYIYGTDERPQEPGHGRRMVLARVAPEAFGDFGRWRFYDNGAWVGDFRRATPLAPGMATEYSVNYAPALGRFLVVGHDTLLSPDIVARSAPAPWGPWSDAVKLYHCPEAARRPGVFCYAGKTHPELASAGDELIITYAANAFALADVLRDASLYWPRFVRVKLGVAQSGR
jgi:Domain of unknown function (DUF4185)